MSPGLALLGITAFVVEVALFVGIGVVAFELGGGGFSGSVAAVLALVATAVAWGLFVAPRAIRRLPTVPRAAVSVALCIATGTGLVVVGHPRWGWVVALAGAVIVAAQVVVPHAADTAGDDDEGADAS